MSLPELIALIALVALIFYAVLGGADFGAGIWDLFATGKRQGLQRQLIEKALAPVWEANHVWLILAVVLLFVCFPPAYAAMSIALHIPLTVLLLGVVARGSAFVFRQYGPKDDRTTLLFGRIFAIASTVTPVALGVIIGALTLGQVELVSGWPRGGFFASWLHVFPFAVGAFTLALFAFSAAVFLTTETAEAALQDDFRRRALVSGALVLVLAFLSALTAGVHAEPFFGRLLGSWWSWPLQLATGAAALSAFYALWTRRFRWARGAAILQVALIVLGWGLAQAPYLVPPLITIENAAAPPATLVLVAWALGAGSLLLFPSLYWMLRLFKR